MLRTGDVDLFRSLSTSTATSTLLPSQIEDLVLDVSTQLFDKSTVASIRSRDIRLSLDVLSALPTSSPRAKSQRSLSKQPAACPRSKSNRSCDPVSPWNRGRSGRRRTRWISSPDCLPRREMHIDRRACSDVANRLCGLAASSDKGLVEARTLAMLADAATVGEDFDDAAEFCQRLVDKVSSLRSRPPTASSEAIVELGWKTCFQLSKHPGWEDTPRRISMLAHAMVLCPPTQLNAMLRQWQMLDAQLGSELEAGKVFDSAKKEAGGWARVS